MNNIFKQHNLKSLYRVQFPFASVKTVFLFKQVMSAENQVCIDPILYYNVKFSMNL